jgi:hypothetical protein
VSGGICLPAALKRSFEPCLFLFRTTSVRFSDKLKHVLCFRPLTSAGFSRHPSRSTRFADEWRQLGLRRFEQQRIRDDVFRTHFEPWTCENLGLDLIHRVRVKNLERADKFSAVVDQSDVDHSA